MAKKKEIIEIKIDRLKLMRIPGAPPGQLHETKKEKAEGGGAGSVEARPLRPGANARL
jgi:hypothetical protein